MTSKLKSAKTIVIPEIAGAYYILVVGETGSGKSTLVNTVVNYFRGGGISCIKVAVPTRFLPSTEPEAAQNTEDSIHDSTKSCTVGSVPYVFQKLANDSKLKGKTFVVVDTPGLADTSGVGQDDVNIGTILDAANRCPSLSAIILVANGTVSRFGNNVKVTLSRLNGNIPDIALKNIVYVMTNTASKASSNFNVEKAPFAPKYVCYMNNSAFSTDPKTWTARALVTIKDDWRASMFVVRELMQAIMEMGHITTDQFAQMKEQRDIVKSTLHEARCKVEELQQVQSDILDIEAKMRAKASDQERFKDYTSKKMVKRIEWDVTPQHNTLCSTCNVVCHEQCGLDEVQVAGDCRFLMCAAFNGQQHCQKCCGESRCGHNVHYHARKLPREVTDSLDVVLEDVKADYDAATEGLQSATLEMSKLSDSKKLIQDFISKLSRDILVSCQGIKDICKGFNFAEEMQILMEQLEAHRVLLTDPLARDTSQTFINSIKGILQGLHADREAFDEKKKENPVIVAGSYVTIECVDILEHTPGSSPVTSPTAASSRKQTPHAAQESASQLGGGSGGGSGGVWCSKCQERHTSLFACPKVMGGVSRMVVPVSVHSIKSPSVSVSTPPPTAPVSAAIAATPPLPPTNGAPLLPAAPVGFEKLSSYFGAGKFASAFLPKLVDFENEGELQAYAAGHIAIDDIAGLKASLTTDCELSGVQAQTLASALHAMSLV